MNLKGEKGLYNKCFKLVAVTLVVFALCGASFYLGGIFFSDKILLEEKIVQEVSNAVSSLPKEPAVVVTQNKTIVFPECSIDYQDYTPCTDPRTWTKYSFRRLTYLERHCPPLYKRKECLIPPPEGYKLPIRWPKSRDECWYRNVPYNWINEQKSNQNWLKKVDEKFLFPGGGTMFPRGVTSYVNLMQHLIPGIGDGTIRTALDTGCGVASWGGDLLNRGILTVSLAPRDNHEAQVQFALERGIPAILGVLSTQRLPFPSSSFDMAHCSRCLIPWTDFGGIYLLEIHRILRPGGFWVLSGPPINYEQRYIGWNTTIEEQRVAKEKLQKVLVSMCFTPYAAQDDFFIWQKSSNISCYEKLAGSDVYPTMCDDSIEPDSAWYTPLRPCVVPLRENVKSTLLSSLPKWPERLKVASERIRDNPGGCASAMQSDDNKWKKRAEHYKMLLPAIGTDKIRNVMDMNTVYGGLAAALIDDPLWVMNVVSSFAVNTLPVIFDRGLIGTFHDWCEAFSTYPRTYDLLHLDGLFASESQRCEMKYVLLEMDRILRPEGHVVMRESSYFIDSIVAIAKGMRWNCRKENTEDNAEEEKILVCQKTLWYSSQNSTTTNTTITTNTTNKTITTNTATTNAKEIKNL